MSPVGLCEEQCGRLRLDEGKLFVPIIKSREEIESSASTCLLCNVFRIKYARDDEDGDDSAPRKGELYCIADSFVDGSAFDASGSFTNYGDKWWTGVSKRLELYRERGGTTPLDDTVDCREINNDPLSCFPLIEMWMSTCTSSHAACAATSSSMPFRLLDVSQEKVSLVHSEGLTIERYAALSHCWGKEPLLITTTASLAARLEDIQWTSLPKSFQDAVSITRRLGIRYLWIDSLCIIQNSKDDWLKESIKMYHYYKDAYVTISAISAAGGHDGFLHDRPSKWSTKLDQDNLYVRIPRDAWKDVMDASPIFKRAWTLQEQVLSTRILHFGKQELIWECQTCSLRESDIQERKYKAGITVGGLFWHNFKPVLADTEKLTLNPQEAITRWLNVINEYSGRALTKAEDKLPAIAGLAEVIQRATGYTYLAGCWQEEMPRTLLWSRDYDDKPVETTAGQTESKPYIAPSWSWASMNVVVRHEMYFLEHSYPPGKLDMQFVSASTTNVGQNPLGQCTSGSIVLCAWTIAVQYRPKTSKFEFGHDIFAQVQFIVPKHKMNWRRRRDQQAELKLGHAVLDDRAQEAAVGDCTLIRITEQDYGSAGIDDISVYCLLIVPNDLDKSRWKRIGFATVSMRDLKSETIRVDSKRTYNLEDWVWREFEIV